MIHLRGIPIGTCGLCGGPVTVPADWHSVTPPTPTCQACGAIAAQHGPVLPMVPAPPPAITTTGTGGADWVLLPTATGVVERLLDKGRGRKP